MVEASIDGVFKELKIKEAEKMLLQKTGEQ
jgi:hypothetical protein